MANGGHAPHRRTQRILPAQQALPVFCVDLAQPAATLISRSVVMPVPWRRVGGYRLIVTGGWKHCHFTGTQVPAPAVRRLPAVCPPPACGLSAFRLRLVRRLGPVRPFCPLIFSIFWYNNAAVRKMPMNKEDCKMMHLFLAIIYVAFISLGLPDALLGAAWPSMYQGFGVPLSFAGILSMLISLGTIVSSLQSDRLTRKLGTGKVTAISVAMTAAALFGFSVSHSFPVLCLWAIPYGLGAGSVDASLNNYVALHYESRHMSWLHCMWGIGATLGPSIMGHALAGGSGWNLGYWYIAVFQVALTAILLCSLPLWKAPAGARPGKAANAVSALSLPEIIRISGAKEVMLCFFCYCALEQTTGLWASSYLTLHKGIAPETAASFASLFFIGITIGRAFSGFLTMRFNDVEMVRMGQRIIAAGVLTMLLPLSSVFSLAGLILIGLGCAPVYPCLIHATPAHFGAERSQAIIGIQMASAYIGTCLMPPLFGIIANRISAALLPLYLLGLLVLMAFMHEQLHRKTASLPGPAR